MARITCVVVDDEALPRRQLLSLLEKEADVVVLAEADRKHVAVDLIESLEPDLVFLDIRMPGGGGFEILDELKHKPRVIFVTAYDQFAVRAFEVNAVDYLLKPVTQERLQASLNRFFPMRADLPIDGANINKSMLDSKLVPIGNTGHFVPVSNLLYIQSDDHYTRVFVDGEKDYQIRQSIREWLELLPESPFFKVERGMILNTKKIVSANLSSSGGEVILGESQVVLRLGSRASQRLREYLDFSAGG